MPTPTTARRAFVRPTMLAIVLWVFGLSTSTLLVGVWGRAVTTDHATLTAGAQAALDESTVSDRLTRWALDELGQIEGMDPTALEPAIHEVVSSPEATVVLDSLIEATVRAALAPSGTETQIDVTTALRPLAPVIADHLARHGLQVGGPEIDVILDRAGTLVLATEEDLGVVRSIDRGRAVLTVVSVIGVTSLLMLGWAAVWLADDRARMVRSLAHRLVISAVTFLVFLRVGAWAVDPGGGRSSAGRALAVLLGSNTLIPMAVAGMAGVVSLGATIALRRRASRRRLVQALSEGVPAPASSG